MGKTTDEILGEYGADKASGYPTAAQTGWKMEVPESTVDATEPAGKEEQPRMTYAQMFERLNPRQDRELSDEDKRKMRREGLMSAIGDGLTALSATFYRGGGLRYDPSSGLSATTKARWDRLIEQQQAKGAAWAEGMMRAKQLDDAAEQQERSWKRTLEQQAKADARADAKEDRENIKLELKAQMDKAKQDLEWAKLQGNQELAQKKYEQLVWYQGQYLSYLRGKGSGGDKGKPGEYPWYDEDGNLHFAHSYEAMRQNAINAGTWNDATQVSTTTKTKSNGRKTETTTTETTKPAKGSSKPKTGTKKDKKGRTTADLGETGTKRNNGGKKHANL